MTQQTRYRYEKRIKELEAEVERLRPYRRFALEVFTALKDHNCNINWKWVLAKYKDLLQ